MKAVIGLVVALAFTLSVVPAVASDSFHALSRLPAVEQAGLAPLSDDQLAAVEGALRLVIIVQVAVVNQINVCALCRKVAQVNAGATVQPVRVQ
jgi:hypothetical protein